MFGDLTENDPEGVLSFRRVFKKDVTVSGFELHQRKFSPTSSGSQQELAVCVRHAYKHYGIHKNPIVVLTGLNMTISKGAIYALLGASGCGKTTLLGCILGCRKLNSGAIWILGGSPGSKVAGVPGPRVGYMPQDTALYIDLTIDETFLFYGWVAGMTRKKIQERGEFLKQLFMVPDTKQLVGTLSGGQQRRVSLASALLHEPEVLILDEPTVGLDPVLRETIWQHLVNITTGGNTTVVLTTHYIEEARQAHVVGLMRGGCLLAEEQPEKLILRYGGTTLEDVFLKLSVLQNEKHHFGIAEQVASGAMEHVNGSEVAEDKVSDRVPNNGSSSRIEKELFNVPQNGDFKTNRLPENSLQKRYVSQFSDYVPNIRGNHLKALVWKGLKWMMRNYLPMLCAILLPVTQVPIFCLAIGHDPVDLHVAVVNYETYNTVNCNNTLTCDSKQLSCSYLKYLERRALTLIYYDSEEDARESVLNGKTYASIVVKRNYSAALRVRLDDWFGTKPWDIKSSEIDVFRDVSNKHIALQLKVYLYDTFLNFVEDFAESCGLSRKVLKVPLKWEMPIYGVKYPSFTDYILPGLLVILTFFLASVAMAFLMIIERREVSFERTFVIGITETELLIAQIVCQFIVMASQTFMSLVCAFVFFHMTQRGSYVVIVVHTLLTGFSGMCFGLLISCICDREATAMFAALSSVLPMLLLGGIIWPVEAIHPLLQPLANVLPLTKTTESLRSILQRGWGFYSETVYMSFIFLGTWTFIFLTVGILFLKYKKS